MLGRLGRHHPASLLDTAPLAALLAGVLDSVGIPRAIESGALHALAITASSYDTGHSTTFFQGGLSPAGWQRARRIGVPATIGIPHLMASAAMPFIFPAVRVDDQHYGDGSMRQVAPLSPALHLGAERLLVISVGRVGARGAGSPAHSGYPSLAQIGGHALTSIFFDALEADLEQLQRINQAVDLIGNGADGAMRDAAGTRLRKVEHLLLTPSRALDAMAGEYLRSIPRPVRYFLRGIGAMRASGSNLASFLLFEKSYTRAVIRLGYADTMARRDAVAKLLGLDAATLRRRDAVAQAAPSARSPSSAP
jgi:NTE family protein